MFFLSVDAVRTGFLILARQRHHKNLGRRTARLHRYCRWSQGVGEIRTAALVSTGAESLQVSFFCR